MIPDNSEDVTGNPESPLQKKIRFNSPDDDNEEGRLAS
jgi:hypothetical protein